MHYVRSKVVTTASDTSETPAYIYHITCCHVPQDSDINNFILSSKFLPGLPSSHFAKFLLTKLCMHFLSTPLQQHVQSTVPSLIYDTQESKTVTASKK
jgi:hypothetical protein